MSDVHFRGAQSTSAPVRAILLCLLLLLGACAGVVPGVAPKMDGVRTVGIISAVGSKFEVQKIGVTIFGNDLKEFPIDSWGVDDLIIGKARASLGKNLDVRPVTYSKNVFASQRVGCIGMGDIVRADASPQGLDAYVVIGRSLSRFGSTNQNLHGLGIVQMSGAMIRNDSHFVHALYNVNVIDGRAFTCKAVATAAWPDSHFLATIRGPNQQVDQAMWPTLLDAASNPRLKAVVVDLIDKSLPTTLQQLQLTNEPRDASRSPGA